MLQCYVHMWFGLRSVLHCYLGTSASTAAQSSELPLTVDGFGSPSLGVSNAWAEGGEDS